MKRKKKYEYVEGNDFRIWSIRVICGNQYGIKRELINAIGQQMYNHFLTIGYIYEPPECLDEFKIGLKLPDYYKREWITTSVAYKRAKQLNLSTRFYYFKLPSTVKRSIWYQIKSKLFKLWT